MKGWFDAFREDGGPTLYSDSNRTSVVGDVSTFIIYIIFSTLFISFLLVFPGIRKEKFTTLISVTISLFVGAVILVSQHGTEWHVAQGSISSSYRAFSDEKIFAQIGVKIGLNSVNITLQATSMHKEKENINFNERFYWIEASEIKKEFKAALIKGLPYPILTVAEYLSVDLEGFCWGRWYRQAGYYSHFLLWTAFASWVMTNIMMCVVPRYGAYMMQMTGGLMLFTNVIYFLLLPKIPLMVKMEEGVTLTFKFGWCYWLILCAGLLSVVFGTLIAIVEFLYPNKFSTILLVDYDTPYNYFVTQKDHPLNSELEAKHLQPRKSLKFGIDNKAYEVVHDGDKIYTNPAPLGDNASAQGTTQKKPRRQHVVGWKQSLTDVAGEESPEKSRTSSNPVPDDGKGIRHPRLTRKPSGEVNIAVANSAAMW